MGLNTAALPDFPWDSLAPLRARAEAHPDGIVDLSVGTPVDPTPDVVQERLRAASNWAGYPTTHGTAQVREAIAGWFAQRRGVPDVDPRAVLPTVGSKELVALLPSLMGLGPGDTVVFPSAAYPTYDVGAVLAGARARAADAVAEWADDPTVRLVWVNSPSNPTGAVAGVDELREVVQAARRLGAVVASDECYAELAWEEPWVSQGVPSILDPRVSEGDHTGLLAVYSLSKQSNLAGYRAAFVAGCPTVVSRLVEARKHMGLIVPGPVQDAMVAALTDPSHVVAQREVYGKRRAVLASALRAAGWRIDHSQAVLYLWSTRNEDCGESLGWLAERGILAAPGAFYGAAGGRHVRIALTATDERIASAAHRLAKSQ